MVREALAIRSVKSSPVCMLLDEIGPDEANGKRQSIELVSASGTIASRGGIDLSARLPSTIAYKDMRLVFGGWSLLRSTILTELRVLEVVFVAAELPLVDKAPSFETLDSVDCRAAPPSADTL